MPKLKLPVPSSRLLTVVWTTVIVTLLIGGVILTMLVLDLTQSRENSRDDRADLRFMLERYQERLDQEEADSDALAAQVEALGEEPVVETSPPNPSDPARPRPTGVTPGAVLTAVDALLDDALEEACDGSCEPEDGTDGADGADSTTPGPAGADSTVPGPEGKPGKDGKDGTDGKDGEDGRGIESMTCTSTGIAIVEQTITYTDGTTETITCDTLPPVDPTPDPEASTTP